MGLGYRRFEGVERVEMSLDTADTSVCATGTSRYNASHANFVAGFGDGTVRLGAESAGAGVGDSV